MITRKLDSIKPASMPICNAHAQYLDLVAKLPSAPAVLWLRNKIDSSAVGFAELFADTKIATSWLCPMCGDMHTVQILASRLRRNAYQRGNITLVKCKNTRRMVALRVAAVAENGEIKSWRQPGVAV